MKNNIDLKTFLLKHGQPDTPNYASVRTAVISSTLTEDMVSLVESAELTRARCVRFLL